MDKKNDLVVGHFSFGPKNLEPPKIPDPPLKISATPIRIEASTGSFPPIVTCLIAECPNNKGHRCGKPSAINIGLDGKCGVGMDAKKHFRAIKKITGGDIGTP